MTTLFLTSGPSFYKDGKHGLISDRVNNKDLIVELKRELKGYSNIVFVCSNPDDYETTEMYASLITKSLSLSGIKFDMGDIIDSRNWLFSKSLITNADLVVLMGGDTLTQMQFFNDIELSDKLKKCKGIILGISAGSVNMAKNAYCSKDKYNETTYYKGLSLTSLNIEPHFDTNDKKRIKEVLIEDSKKQPFVALDDDSFIIVKGNTGKIFGNAYYFKDGDYKKIHNLNEVELQG